MPSRRVPSTSCARLLDATVQCWGLTLYGAVGDGSDGSVTYRLSPCTVVGLAPAWRPASMQLPPATAGDNTSCAIMSDGGIRCWGYNEFGQGGHGHGSQDHTAVRLRRRAACLDIDGDGVTMLGTDGLLLARPRSAQRQRGHAIGHGHRRHPQTWFAQWQHLTARCGVTGLSP